jgi:DNA polymerase/3'-5' exonuclease PolX
MKQEFALKDALDAANEIADHLRTVCHRVEIAGSIRRECNKVHDIDIVIWPIVETLHIEQIGLFGQGECIVNIYPRRLLQLFDEKGWGTFNPKEYPRKLNFQYGEIPVELYICEQDGSNFEALWQLRTGSAEFNKNLVIRAMRLGLQYRAGYGIFRGEERIDDGTEAGIFTALGLKLVSPAERR